MRFLGSSDLARRLDGFAVRREPRVAARIDLGSNERSCRLEAVQREIMEEKAGALARTERRLLAALDAYRGQPHPAAHDDALWDVVEAVTDLVVQREACGLRDAKNVFQFYRVPTEVVARIGIRRASSSI